MHASDISRVVILVCESIPINKSYSLVIIYPYLGGHRIVQCVPLACCLRSQLLLVVLEDHELPDFPYTKQKLQSFDSSPFKFNGEKNPTPLWGSIKMFIGYNYPGFSVYHHWQSPKVKYVESGWVWFWVSVSRPSRIILLISVWISLSTSSDSLWNYDRMYVKDLPQCRYHLAE